MIYVTEHFLFGDYLHPLHPNESSVNDTIDTQKDASYLDYDLEINKE